MRIFFYGLVRVVVFVALWALFYYVMDLGMIFGVIAATILTFAVSYLFLGRLRAGADRGRGGVAVAQRGLGRAQALGFLQPIGRVIKQRGNGQRHQRPHRQIRGPQEQADDIDPGQGAARKRIKGSGPPWRRAGDHRIGQQAGHECQRRYNQKMAASSSHAIGTPGSHAGFAPSRSG